MGCRCKERRMAIISAVKETAKKGLTIISGKAATK